MKTLFIVALDQPFAAIRLRSGAADKSGHRWAHRMQRRSNGSGGTRGGAK